jgi:hypothetical protein
VSKRLRIIPENSQFVNGNRQESLTKPHCFAKFLRLYNKETTMHVVPFLRLEIAARVINEFLEEHQTPSRPGISPEDVRENFRRNRDIEHSPRGVIHKIWLSSQKDSFLGNGPARIEQHHEDESEYGTDKELSAELSGCILAATGGKWEEEISGFSIPDDRLRAACDVVNAYYLEHRLEERCQLDPEGVRHSWETMGGFCEHSPRGARIDVLVLIDNRRIHGGALVHVQPGPVAEKTGREMSAELRARILEATGGKWEDPIFVDESLNSPSPL